MTKSRSNSHQKIWTEVDFERMNWHDCALYGFAFEYIEESFQNNILFDIDAILEWVVPTVKGDCFKFWTAPATLIFENSFNFSINIDHSTSIAYPLEIYEIQLLKKTPTHNGYFDYDWKIIVRSGYITLTSTGYQQILRQKPQYSQSQFWGIQARNGISFSKEPYTD